MTTPDQTTPHQFHNELTYHRDSHSEEEDRFHEAYESAVSAVRAELGSTHHLRIGDEEVTTNEYFRVKSPGNLDVLIGEFAMASSDAVDTAVQTATEAFEGWQKTEWQERVDLVREAATVVADRKFSLAALLTLENGKNRTEAMADVDEAIDFLRYYALQFEHAGGYREDTGEPVPGEHCSNRLQPYGVFGVIAPFNFPLAILAGMTTGAIITGNTAVVKPGEKTPAIAHAFVDALEAAGFPAGVVNLVTGNGEQTGSAIVDHEAVTGIVFTGSRAVGRHIQEQWLKQEKFGPVIAEMGGKNPVIVTASADIEKAVSGVCYGAFGFSGQKCSATSRVYILEEQYQSFLDLLITETEAIPDYPPTHRKAVLSPVIDASAIDRYQRITTEAKNVGTVHTGGAIVDSVDLPTGRYVRPTVISDVPHTHALARDEHFLPVVTLHPVDTLKEAIRKANDSQFGLCAGLFAEDETEIDTWFSNIDAGMTYVNRDRSATTGALVGAQPFGGWKASGTSGFFAGGRWYLPQFMRQQSRTRVLP